MADKRIVTEHVIHSAFLGTNLSDDAVLFLAPTRHDAKGYKERMLVEVQLSELKVGDIFLELEMVTIHEKRVIARLSVCQVDEVVPGDGVQMRFTNIIGHGHGGREFDALAGLIGADFSDFEND